MTIPTAVPGELIPSAGWNEMKTAIETIPATVAAAVAADGTVVAAAVDAVADVTASAFTLNVRFYGPCGNGDATEDNAAFAAWSAAMRATSVLDLEDAAPTVARATKAQGYIPPGRYLITSPEVLLATASAVTNGWVVKGAGRRVTTIVFTPAAPAALLKNDDQYRLVEFEGITFVGGNDDATFLNSISQGGGAQNYTFRNCEWLGTWDDCIRLAGDAGANNNSEFLFDKCRVEGEYTNFLVSGDGGANQAQDNFVNFDFISCEIQYQSGVLLNMIYGGCVRFLGGSLILQGTGTLFKLDTATHFSGVTQLYVAGQRIELHTAASKLIDCIWKNGNVTFDTCLFDAAPIADTTVIASFYGSSDTGPMVLWNNCRLAGLQEYKYDGNTWNAPPGRALYRNCVITQFDSVKDSIVNTAIGGAVTHGGAWLIDFERCQGAYAYGSTGSYDAYDVAANWRLAQNAEVRVMARSIKTPIGTLPAAAGWATAEAWLPLGAVVLSVWFYAPADAAAYPFDNWSYTLKTSEGAPTTLASIATAADQRLGFNARTVLAAPFVCDTDAKRKLKLIAANNGGYNLASGLCVVEYLPGS